MLSAGVGAVRIETDENPASVSICCRRMKSPLRLDSSAATMTDASGRWALAAARRSGRSSFEAISPLTRIVPSASSASEEWGRIRCVCARSS